MRSIRIRLKQLTLYAIFPTALVTYLNNPTAPSYPHSEKSYGGNLWEQDLVSSTGGDIWIHWETASTGSGSSPLLNIEFSAGGAAKLVNEPSHIRLCRALLPQKESELTIDYQDINGREKIIIVEEDDSVCTNMQASYTSLLQMFASAMVARASQISGRKVYYEHHCGKRMAYRTEDWTHATIQQMMPPQITFRGTHDVDVNFIMDSCGSCVAEYDRFLNDETLEEKRWYEIRQNLAVPNCLLFPQDDDQKNENKSDQIDARVDMIWQLLPTIQFNLRLAAKEWRDAMMTRYGGKFWRKRPGEVISAMFAGVGSRDDIQTDDETIHTPIPQQDDAVIYLNCINEQCDSSNKDSSAAFAIPFYVYAEHIPRSAKTLRVLVSPNCVAYVDGCLAHGHALREYLASLYPRSFVTLDHTTFSTAGAYTHMTLSRNLISPPTLTSILPSLANRYAVLVHDEKRSPTYLSPLSDLHRRCDIHNNETSLDVLRASLSSKEALPLLATTTPSNEMSVFVYNTPPLKRARSCRQLRGRLGEWVEDMDYAYSAQYTFPIEGYSGIADRQFEPTEEEPYRLPTIYKWVDNIQDCPVELANLEKMCDVMQMLQMKRILFVGDTIMFDWSQSFWKLMGMETTAGKDSELQWTETVECPISNEYTFEVAFVRNDELNDNQQTDVEFGTPNCSDGRGYCTNWVEYYTSSPNRTLLLVNTGAHHSKDAGRYEAQVHTFLDLVDKLNRPKDLIYWRSTVPGHSECREEGIRPYKNYSEYTTFQKQSSTTKKDFGWNLFPGYNDYVDLLLHEREYGRKTSNSYAPDTMARIEMLDVFPMTVLRPDGHASGRDCVGCGLRVNVENGLGDCLHYSSPGPMDWWSHLAYSNLKDFAQEEHEEKEDYHIWNSGEFGQLSDDTEEVICTHQQESESRYTNDIEDKKQNDGPKTILQGLLESIQRTKDVQIKQRREMEEWESKMKSHNELLQQAEQQKQKRAEQEQQQQQKTETTLATVTDQTIDDAASVQEAPATMERASNEAPISHLPDFPPPSDGGALPDANAAIDLRNVDVGVGGLDEPSENDVSAEVNNQQDPIIDDVPGDTAAKISLPQAEENQVAATTKVVPVADELQGFKNVWDERERGDIPVFWHVAKAGGSTIKDLMGRCYRMTIAAESGITEGHGQDTEIAKVLIGGDAETGAGQAPFVNVDTTTVDGLQRAGRLGLAQSGLADGVVIRHLFEASAVFEDGHRGRLFSLFRHPVDRAISMFHYLQYADWEKTYAPELAKLTLEEFAQSKYVEDNWITRYLCNEHSGDLNKSHLEKAKKIIHEKFLVGLLSRKEESLLRFEKFFGWKYIVNPDNQEKCRSELLGNGANSNKKKKKTVEKPKPGSKAFEMIADKNRFDIELYHFIESVFDEQAQHVMWIPDTARFEGSKCCACDAPPSCSKWVAPALYMKALLSTENSSSPEVASQNTPPSEHVAQQ